MVRCIMTLYWVLGAREQVAIEMASVRSCNKLSLCPTKPVLAGSRTDPLLTKAEPISHGGSAAGIMHLKEGKTAVKQQLAERNENM